MASVTLTGNASGPIADNSFIGEMFITGNNDDQGIVTSSTSDFSWLNDTVVGGDAPIIWGVDGVINSSASSDVTALPKSGQSFPHDAVYDTTNPAKGIGNASATFQFQQDFCPGTASFLLLVTLQYVTVRLDTIDPPFLDPSGGQLVTLEGAGFSDVLVERNGFGSIVRSLVAITFTQLDGPNFTEATSIVVLNDNTVTFVSPELPAGTYAMVVGFNLGGGSADIFFPSSGEFVVTSTSAAAWWYNPDTGEYVFGDDPGAPFIPAVSYDLVGDGGVQVNDEAGLALTLDIESGDGGADGVLVNGTGIVRTFGYYEFGVMRDT